jgi:hypothetical protein
MINIEERTDDWLAERRDQIKVELAKIKVQEDNYRLEREEIDEEFKRRFKERGSSSTKTSKFTTSIKTDFHYPKLVDQTEFEEYVLDTKKLHLLQKRISPAAVKEELAILAQEKAALLKELEEEEWAEELCREICIQEFDFQYPEGTPGIQDFLKNKIEEYYSIPGVEIVEKEVINQVRTSRT